MMFLGVVLHTGSSYLQHRAPEEWSHSDPDRSVTFDVLAYVIHSFRMPVFFALAGFFSALVVAQRGWWGFAAHRAQRVLVPLLLFVLPLWVADTLAVALATDRAPGALARAWGALGLPDDLAVLGHLWFLYYLLVFYVLLALVVGVGRRFLDGAAVLSLGGWLGSRAAPVVAAAPLALVLLPLPLGIVTTGSGLVPEPVTLLAYGPTFLMGAWLYGRRDLLPRLRDHGLLFLGVGGALVIVDLLLLLAQVGGAEEVSLRAPLLGGALQVLIAVGSALATSFLVFGLLGTAQRLWARPSPKLRYAADASYWVYLVHHCLVLYFTARLSTWRAPAELKATVVIAVVTLLGLLSYHLLVRSTPLGTLLNGKRHPFALPRP